MNRVAPVVLIAVLAVVRPATADDSGQFVVRLGNDTTSVERYTRTHDHVIVSQVGRAPRVLHREFDYEWANGAFKHMTLVVTPPGSTTPTQTIEGVVDGDSLRMKIRSGTAPAQNLAVGFPAGAIAVGSSSAWVGYEHFTMKLAASRADSVRGWLYLIGFPAIDWASVHRLGRDSMLVVTGHSDVFHVKVDKAGRILGTLPISGTGKFAAQRVDELDLDALSASFAAREKSGAGIGALSPRDTLKATAGGATLWVDYGRPGKRGRVIFGDVVPYGEVWRTGANAATQFRTDKALDFGGSVVPAGFYTLWTLPTANGWTLTVNGQTGQWGTQHDPSKDLFKIEMKLSTLPDPVERFTIGVDPTANGGVLIIDWDRTRAEAEFTTVP